MANDAIAYAQLATAELGADVADVALFDTFDPEVKNLPGLDVLFGAGLAVAAAFFTGMVNGMSAEASEWGESVGRGVIRRLRQLVGRLTSRPKDPAPDLSAAVQDSAVEYKEAVAATLVRLRELPEAERATALRGAEITVEVSATLRALGLNEARADILSGRVVEALAAQVLRDALAVG